MIPPANNNFDHLEPLENDERGPWPRLTPTAVDLVNPFASSMGPSDTLDIPHETQLTVDPPTKLVRRSNFRELPPGTIVGENYEIDARLGAGAMGEVYGAHHVRLGKRVAIKVIRQRLSEDDAAIRRFAMEAKVLAQIQHPSIVAVEHVGELPDGRAYFVMEYLHGESLLERLGRGDISLREALRILDQMARGLEAAHGSGIIHRDLKPDNTFLVNLPLPGEEPTVKLVDFGLAKLAAENTTLDQYTPRVQSSAAISSASELTECSQSGVAIGTPLYMSPEQARGPDVDHRTDIYALGCVAYELVLGVRPFPHARTAPEIYAAHLHASPPLPRAIWPEIPLQLDLVMFAMLAKDPQHRPTLAQVRSVIANLRASTPSQQAPTLVVGPRAPKEKLRSLTITMIAFGALILGAALGVTFSTALLSKRNSNLLQPIGTPLQSTPVTPAPRIERAATATSAGTSTPGRVFTSERLRKQ